MRSASSPITVSMTIGIFDLARRSRQSERPSSPGSIKSRITRSMLQFARALRISLPSRAAVTL